MEWRKAAVALTIIALVVFAGIFVYKFQATTSLSQQVSQSSSFSVPQLYTGEAPLYQKAKQEGAVTMYAIWTTSEIGALAQAFQKRYPGITAQFMSLDDPTILTRVSQEFNAQKNTVDVIGSDSVPPILYSLGAIQDYQTVQKDALITNDPRMAVIGISVVGIAYNTKLIDQANLPKSYEDLTNPKYSKQFPLALDDPMRSGALTLMLVGLRDYWKDDVKWANFIKGLRALKVPTFQSSKQMGSLLSAGEYAICVPCYSQDIITRKTSGAPVDWVPGIPPVAYPRFAAIYKYAPHPNAAKLLAEWLASSDSAPVWCSMARSPARANTPCSAAVEQMFPSRTSVITVNLPSDLSEFIDQHIKPNWIAPENP
jgi:iron(III) transport system substrate-binding protein